MPRGAWCEEHDLFSDRTIASQFWYEGLQSHLKQLRRLQRVRCGEGSETWTSVMSPIKGSLQAAMILQVRSHGSYSVAFGPDLTSRGFDIRKQESRRLQCCSPPQGPRHIEYSSTAPLN